MKAKVLFFAFALAGVFISCGDDSSGPESDVSLMRAYYKNSLPALQNILDNWSEASKPISETEYSSLSDAEKDICDLYAVFYDPFNYDKYGVDTSGPYARGNDYYAGVKYIFIQNEVKYYIGEPSPGTRKDLYNFRPVLPAFPAKVIYYGDDYKKQLNKFAGIYDTAKAAYLGSCFKFTWMYAYINPLTEPNISAIKFNASLDSALVEYHKDWHLGEARLYKDNGTWKWIDARLTAVVVDIYYQP